MTTSLKTLADAAHAVDQANQRMRQFVRNQKRKANEFKVIMKMYEQKNKANEFKNFLKRINK